MVDITLAKIIAKVEGGAAGARALRFEETIYDRFGDTPSKAEVVALITIGNLNECSHHTARMIAATSWGSYQLMGFNIYELGWASDIFEFVSDQVKQADLFGLFLNAHSINFAWVDLLADETKRAVFIHGYNGPAGGDEYWSACIAAATRLGLPTTA